MRIILIFLLFINSALASTPIFITDYALSDRDDVLELTQSSEYESVELDCLSFLNGLHMDKKFFMLYENECLEIGRYIVRYNDQNKAVCLRVDFEQKQIKLTTSSQSECR